jgi:SP family general alpha glucoside:H+ symporter-like MFS transporter
MPPLGRRSLFMYGLALMGVCLFIIGCLSLAPSSNSAAKWGIASLALVYVFFYDTTVGPVTYALVAEIPATSLRTRKIVLARICYNAFNIASNVITPYMFNPTAWNLKAKSGYVWAGICASCLVWIFFLLPEPQGRTFGELDILFFHKVKERDFKRAAIDSFDSTAEDEAAEEKHNKM